MCAVQDARAPNIGGEHYWDGGFMGNPAIFPVLVRLSLQEDLEAAERC
jgi:hypothetical protein